MRRKAPAYRHFKPKNLAVVRINGKDFYLGKYDSPESWQEYHRLIAEWHGSGQCNGSAPQPRNGFFGISCLIEAYLKFAETYYRYEGRQTREYGCLAYALDPLADLYELVFSAAELPPVQFDPRRAPASRRGSSSSKIFWLVARENAGKSRLQCRPSAFRAARSGLLPSG